MQTKRHAGTALVTVTVGLAALTAGCGGSSTRATPLETSTTVRTTTSVGAPATRPGVKSTPTTTRSTAATARTAARPSPAQLAGLQQALDDAGASLAAGGNAIAGADVNQAQTQEGSAP